MVTKRFSLLFRLKKPNKYLKGNMPVYMRITIDSLRTELSISREFDPGRWNKKSGRASGNKEDAKTLNAYLETLQVKVHEAHRELLAANEIVTVEKLKNKLSGRTEERPRMLLEIFAEHNKKMSSLIENNEYAKGTLTHFETTYLHTKSFLQWKYQVTDISITKVDYGFISDFEFYLKTEIRAHSDEISGRSKEDSADLKDPAKEFAINQSKRV